MKTVSALVGLLAVASLAAMAHLNAAAASDTDAGERQRAAVLRGVTSIHVRPTVTITPDKVKEDFAPVLVEDTLRNALESSNFEVQDGAVVQAWIELREFSSGSQAKRFLVGFGAGRATVEGNLIFAEVTGGELVRVDRIKTRGKVMWSSYQGANTQRAQAFSEFQMRLIEEIARLK